MNYWSPWAEGLVRTAYVSCVGTCFSRISSWAISFFSFKRSVFWAAAISSARNWHISLKIISETQILSTSMAPSSYWEFSLLKLNKKMAPEMSTVFLFINLFTAYKLGCVVRMVVDSILLHTECGPNDHRKDAPPFNILLWYLSMLVLPFSDFLLVYMHFGCHHYVTKCHQDVTQMSPNNDMRIYFKSFMYTTLR